ncbi:MAG: [Fe-Fe] hydrogenase large subunit C-terminal domain-containing protein [Candidatus Ozemobacteraceae bacterium]
MKTSKAGNSRTIQVTINGRIVRVPSEITILDAARYAGIRIPSLCSTPGLPPTGGCRVCVVEVDGETTLQASCHTRVREGMDIQTNTPRIRRVRQMSVELLLANHPVDCPTCDRSLDCRLRELAWELGIRRSGLDGSIRRVLPLDSGHAAVIHDPNKCILCGRCVQVCMHGQGVEAVGFFGRGDKTVVQTAFSGGLAESPCTGCGQCILVCPVGARTEKSHIEGVWNALSLPDRVVVAQVAPAVRVTLGEHFGFPSGTPVSGRIAAALRRVGFSAVFETAFAADLTAIESAHELMGRLAGEGKLPLLTSCSPGWTKYLEHFFPELLPHLSTCKSPQQMFGAIAKSWYAEQKGLSPEKLVVVSIMPCTAKKYEAERPEMRRSGRRDVDFVLTDREVARMLREAGIDFRNMPEESFDEPFGTTSGAGDLFGASGGVLQAVLQTFSSIHSPDLSHTKNSLSSLKTGLTMDSITWEATDYGDGEINSSGDEGDGYESVSGNESRSGNGNNETGDGMIGGLHRGSIRIGDQTLLVALGDGLRAGRMIAEELAAGNPRGYHLVEVMCCPGGCIGGGGLRIFGTKMDKTRRSEALSALDATRSFHKPLENPFVQKLYAQFLQEPNGPLCRELLHTGFTPRSRYW